MEATARGPIRMGFLGADDTTADLVRAVLEHPRFELAGICEFDGSRASAELATFAGRIRPIADWEDLLDSERIDAVVVARSHDEDRRAEQLRKFVQTGMPVLAAHPVVGSMLVYYELDMIRRETGSVALPHAPERHHPGVQALAEMVRSGGGSPIGKVEHLTCERCITEPTRARVESQFARDVDVIRAIAGEATRLGAMAAGSGPGAYAGLGVQMSGPGGVSARWSALPIQGGEGARITLAGSRGRAALEVRGDEESWTLETTSDGHTRTQKLPPWDAAKASLEALAAALDGAPAEPDWVDAARGVELAETIDRSLQKGRTIELHYEDYTEDATFKGTMTSVGCGLLLLGAFVLALVGVAEQMHVPNVKYWPYVLVALFGVFLFVQLAMLTKGKRSPGADTAES